MIYNATNKDHVASMNVVKSYYIPNKTKITAVLFLSLPRTIRQVNKILYYYDDDI